MKWSLPNITIAPKVERPLPEKKILWCSEEGGQAEFPTIFEAYARRRSDDPVPLKEFGVAVSQAQERVWIVDEYLLMPDSKKSNVQKSPNAKRIDIILSWLKLDLVASDIRLLTKRHQEVDSNELKKFQSHMEKINNHRVRDVEECQIEVRMLEKQCDFIHDRFAIIDDELWHFGGTVGGFHTKVSAASRGWRATDHGAIEFFERVWNKGARK